MASQTPAASLDEQMPDPDLPSRTFQVDRTQWRAARPQVGPVVMAEMVAIIEPKPFDLPAVSPLPIADAPAVVPVVVRQVGYLAAIGMVLEVFPPAGALPE